MEDSIPADKSVTNPLVVGVSAIGPCILWTGYRNCAGYGTRSVDGRKVRVHRQAWIDIHGDPGGLLVCHRCDNRACINVDHLFLGTAADNSADMVAKGRQSRVGGPKGERQWRAKLTDDHIREIRSSMESGLVIARRLNISDSNVSHIRLRKTWAHVTNADNMADLTAKDRVINGERHGRAKLTADQVREIRASSESGVVIAGRFGISGVAVSHIRLRKTWKHLP